MAYDTLGAGLSGANDLPPIVAVIPSPIPAGPGQQVIMVRGTGLQLPYTLSVVPDDASQITNPTTQGYGGPLYDVSADGMSAKVLLDLRGNVTTWQARVISPYTNQQSPWLPIQSVAGAAVPFDFNQYVLEAGMMTPVVVIATTQLVAGAARDGSQNKVVVTGGSGVANGQVINESGPGILYNRPGGTWEFVPMAALSASELVQQFGDLVRNDPDYEVDPFGLPLPSKVRVQQIAWVDANGNPVVSPWFAAYLAHATAGTSTPRTPTETTMANNAPGNAVPVAVVSPSSPASGLPFPSMELATIPSATLPAPLVEVGTLPVQSPLGPIAAVQPMNPLLVVGALVAVVFFLGKHHK